MLFELISHPVKGRCLIAKENIEAGTLILTEQPSILGPAKSDFDTCPGCYIALNSFDYFCSSCTLPLCSKQCETTSKLHRNFECRFLTTSLEEEKPRDLVTLCSLAGASVDQNFRDKNCKSGNDCKNLSARWSRLSGNFDYLIYIRALSVKRFNPDLYSNHILKLHSHLEERKSFLKSDSDVIEYRAKDIISIFQLKCDEKEMRELLCIFASNGFHLTGPESGLLGPVQLAGLYPKMVAMLNHDCSPNSRTVFTGPGEFLAKVVATRNIEKGEEITISYLRPFHTTLQRRAMLLRTKMFECSCKRCSDPTEFGTFSSAVKCQGCCSEVEAGEEGGYFLSKDPLNFSSNWRCVSCGRTLASSEAVAMDNSLVAEDRKLFGNSGTTGRGPSVNCIRKFIKTYSMYLHQNHIFLTGLRHKLCEALGNSEPFEGLQDIDEKIDACRKLYKLYGTLNQDIFVQGIISIELAETLDIKSKFLEGPKNSSKNEEESNLEEIREKLNFARSVFRHEDENSSECKGLIKKLKTLIKKFNLESCNEDH